MEGFRCLVLLVLGTGTYRPQKRNAENPGVFVRWILYRFGRKYDGLKVFIQSILLD